MPAAIKFALSDFASLTAFRDAFMSYLQPVLAKPWIVGGQPATGLVFQAGVPLSVKHKLGRVPTGWIVTDKTASADLSRAGDADGESIPIVSTTDVSADLLIF